MIRSIVLSLGAFWLVFGSAPVRAADDGALAAAMFAEPTPTATSRACFVRRYDGAHRAAHPRQRVADIMLLVGREAYPDEPGLRWRFQLSTHFTHRKGRFESSGDCRPGGMGENPASPATRIICAVACDGGDIEITPSTDSRSALAQVDHLRIWRPGPQIEDSNDAIDGDDDRTFRLERADISACAPLLPKAERARSRKSK